METISGVIERIQLLPDLELTRAVFTLEGEYSGIFYHAISNRIGSDGSGEHLVLTKKGDQVEFDLSYEGIALNLKNKAFSNFEMSCSN